ncbi:UDP-glucose 4-epimerase [compost metagenome]
MGNEGQLSIAADRKHILVTGAAGFIGMHTAKRLLEQGHSVVGIDNLNDYYDVQLKMDRLSQLTSLQNFRFYKLDLADQNAISSLFELEKFQWVINLAAQPGVRYSIENPHAYISANVVGFMNILEGCRNHQVEHLVYASSSSVYGANTKLPFSTNDSVDRPVSIYAATKKSNELMAHTYSHLFGIPTTGLRFFTVYGPWGRPDMSPVLFASAITEGRPIKVFNYGQMMRDFTYIDDIVEGIARVADTIPGRGEGPPYRLYNIGNNQPVALLDFISEIEEQLGMSAAKELLPIQPGDVLATFADIEDLKAAVGFAPKTSLQDGIEAFIRWFKAYYGSERPADKESLVRDGN